MKAIGGRAVLVHIYPHARDVNLFSSFKYGISIFIAEL